jgi:hypothetical protein
VTTTLRLVPAKQGDPADRGQDTAGPDSGAAGLPAAPAATAPPGPVRPRGQQRSWLARHPAWPVTALVVGYPIWWALGIADFMWIVLAVPMIVRMVAWHAHDNRRVRVPPGFGIWLLFLICALAGVAVLTLSAPGTVASALSHRVISYGDRNLNYLGITVLLLYVGNLTERELPRRRLAWMLGLVALYTTIGGVAGMVMPHLQIPSPFLLLLPKSVQANTLIQASMHPGLSQVQNVLGTPGGRPKAPFDYTNTWGDCLSILLPWLLVGWWHGGSRRQRWIAVATLVISFAPLLYSLNRGVWIGVGVAICYLAVRFAAQGKMAVLGGLLVLIALTGALILATPLQNVVSGRLSKGGSVNLRSNLSGLAIKAAEASPVIGFGDTRQERGSPTSIAIGPSPTCPSCGQLAVGGSGQLFLILICSGFPGAVLYYGFFAFGIWRFRRDTTPYGLAGVLVLLLSFVYMFTYDAVGAPLGFTVLAYALVWKNQPFVRHGRPADADGELEPADPPGRPGTLAVTAGGPA